MKERKNQVIFDEKSNVCYLGNIIEEEGQKPRFVAMRVAIMHDSLLDENYEPYLDQKLTDRALEILHLKDDDSFLYHGSIDEVLNDLEIEREISAYLTDERTKEILQMIEKSKEKQKIKWYKFLPFVSSSNIEVGSLIKLDNGHIILVGGIGVNEPILENFDRFAGYYSNDLVPKIKGLLADIDLTDDTIETSKRQTTKYDFSKEFYCNSSDCGKWGDYTRCETQCEDCKLM